MTAKARIMIAEDEYIICEEIKDITQRLGYEVTATADSAENIRSHHKIPVVFSTAYVDEERIKRAKITMPFGYVLKPIQERDLKVALEMALYVAKVDEERRKAEKLSVETSQLLRNVVDALPACVIVKDRDGNFVLVNKETANFYGPSINGRLKKL